VAAAARVLIPLPDHDVDVTEVAVPWRLLTSAGHEVTFATEQAGTVPAADPRLLFGQLGAAGEAPRFYREMTGSLEFRGTASDDSAAVVVQDGNYLSARWPGDAYLFGQRFLAMLGG
jgi:putative intracellular protease/amidase